MGSLRGKRSFKTWNQPFAFLSEVTSSSSFSTPSPFHASPPPQALPPVDMLSVLLFCLSVLGSNSLRVVILPVLFTAVSPEFRIGRGV